jgi:mycoredoxin
MTENKLQLYGTDWCTKSSAIRNYLQSRWIEFDDFNVELDNDAEQRVRDLYDGKLKFPTLMYEGYHLKNPKIPELNTFLDKHGIE